MLRLGARAEPGTRLKWLDVTHQMFANRLATQAYAYLALQSGLFMGWEQPGDRDFEVEHAPAIKVVVGSLRNCAA